MKIVVSKSMVAHLFANQSQNEARTSSGNFYFYGSVCNSYGSHFVAAVHHGDTVLLNANKYSSTTASQLSELWSACSHLQVFTVANPGANSKAEHRDNFRYLVRKYETEILRVSRARIYNSLEMSERMFANANAYAIKFKIGNRLKAIDTGDILASIKTREAKDTAAHKRVRLAREKRQAAETAKRQAKFDENIAEWRQGLGSYYDLGQYRHNAPVALRLTSDGDIVQTSQGAEFPAAHAKRSIAFVLACFEKGNDFVPNGHAIPLGHFQVNKIDSKNGLLLAGCHTVTRSEIENLAVLIAA